MATSELNLRVTALEAEVEELKKRLPSEQPPKTDWLKQWCASANDDPYFAEAMRLGKKYRESLRPGRKWNQKRKPANSLVRRSAKLSRG